ncbi:MAG: type II toxin-antitoxin system Phd/YefM family antitoxin [Oscillospiraceae bacterium]|nr:type II toxin-antitoxin system Phd/YefM family antitoxin [Oscillospiraceae bacterium]
MKFVSIRDFRNSSKEILERVNNNEKVVITNNGKPAAIMIGVKEDDFEEVYSFILQAKAMKSFHKIREEAAKRGYLTDEEINAEIKASREERRAREKGNKE